MSPRDFGLLLVLAALWGGSFLFMRVAAPVLGPVLLIEFRVLLAGLALLAYMAAIRRLPPLGAGWHHYLVIGVINSALPFVLIATAELQLPASLAATLNATTPLFGALAAAIWLRERLSAWQLLGGLLGLVGVASAVGLGPVPLTGRLAWFVGASLAAAMSYGVAAVYTKVNLPGAQSSAVALYSQLFAAVALLPLVPFALPHARPSVTVIGSVLALALLCTGLAYLLYFHLILVAGPTRATTVTYLSPAFGMLWGTLFLQEPLKLGGIAGFGLILSGVLLVATRKEARPRAALSR